MISVFPGPITCFKTEIISSLDFNVSSLTEDFDITIQVYRKSLGKVKFIPEAINYTQDPQTLKDFCKQTFRWQRGFFQGVSKYHIGTRNQTIDYSIGFQLLELGLYLVQMLVVAPFLIIRTGNFAILPTFLMLDFFVVSLLAFFSAAATKRLNVLASLPYYYFLRWVELGIFLAAFFEVMILRRYKSEKTLKGWKTEGRRYALSGLALKDTA
jgi:cellulose synthase/poly-beta-1,6-N-acetylglucosamine synthase-like glycosyltransferase